MDQSQIDNLARTWMANIAELIRQKTGNPNVIPNIPMHDLDVMVYEDPENAWLVIDSARRMTQDDRMLANIAAGPLENLLSKHGEQFIDRVEALAKADEHFAYLMTGVWERNKMSESLVARIKAIANLAKRHL